MKYIMDTHPDHSPNSIPLQLVFFPDNSLPATYYQGFSNSGIECVSSLQFNCFRNFPVAFM